jgi:hypothetical protein
MNWGCAWIRLMKASDVWAVTVTLIVNRESQKGIVIGPKGQNFKYVRQCSEPELSDIFGVKVALELWVKVEKQWMSESSASSTDGLYGRCCRLAAAIVAQESCPHEIIEQAHQRGNSSGQIGQESCVQDTSLHRARCVGETIPELTICALARALASHSTGSVMTAKTKAQANIPTPIEDHGL